MHLVIGTAGHIDHGKSTLVQALTGIDPDRLDEEKARGITIDLGFAHRQIGGLQVAFVDVPGHERFVRNMLAGATGIDAVLLVVAADESVMPQTREHFAICRLLGVRAGLVALTKCDAADPDLREIARQEVGELVAGSFLEGAPIVDVSARTGQGLDALQQALEAIAPNAPARAREGPARLPIDRAFTMKGFGAVVTGTLQSGVLRADEELELLPAGRRVRVRGLQVHGAKVREAWGGQRVAANLSDIEASAIVRGDLLVTPGAFDPSSRLDVTLELLPDARPLAHGTRVRVHHGTREVMGRVAVAEVTSRGAAAAAAGAARAMEPQAATTVPPGGRARARLRLEGPLVATRGDRLVLRAYSPVVTIGGGLVIDPQPARGALRTPAGLARFAGLDPAASGSEAGDADERATLVMLEERARAGLPVAALGTRLGLRGAAIAAMADRLVTAGRALRVGDLLISKAVDDRLTEALLDLVRRHHRAQPDSEGVPREEARDRLKVTPRVFDDLVERLTTMGMLSGRDRLALPAHRAAVPDADAAALARLDTMLQDAGLKPPDAAEIAQQLALPPATVDRLTNFLVRQKRLVRLGTLVFHQDPLTRLKEETRALKGGATAAAPATVNVATFKARYDVSRKYAIPLLEYLDRERVTRRVGDERVVL
jgi:selenocysteine-specific elongation factor